MEQHKREYKFIKDEFNLKSLEDVLMVFMFINLTKLDKALNKLLMNAFFEFKMMPILVDGELCIVYKGKWF